MSTLGFEEYVEPLKVYLLKYREVEKLFITISRFSYFYFVDGRRSNTLGETDSGNAKNLKWTKVLKLACSISKYL